MSFPSFAAASLVAWLGIAAPATAAVIASNTTGNFNTSGSGFAFGHSVTTGAGGPWNALTFSFFAIPLATPTPYAEGTLFLLSQSFAGLPDALTPATPGYIAHTATITGGAWDFADSVTLQPGTQYFFYMADAVSGAQLLFANTNPYPGGGAHQSFGPASDPYFAIPGGTVDLRFSLQGSLATETPEPASAVLLLPALAALARSPRRA